MGHFVDEGDVDAVPASGDPDPVTRRPEFGIADSREAVAAVFAAVSCVAFLRSSGDLGHMAAYAAAAGIRGPHRPEDRDVVLIDFVAVAPHTDVVDVDRAFERRVFVTVVGVGE